MRMRLTTLLAAAVGCLAAAGAVASEVVKTLQAELSGPDLSSFQVENLVGTMRITAVGGDRITVTATVHGEDAALAGAVRLEKVQEGGTATLRVRYPYGQVGTFRYLQPGSDSDWGFGSFSSSDTYDYDGHEVQVNPRRGKPLYADLDVRVPAGSLHGVFRNLVGRVEAEGLRGDLRFEVEAADLRLRKLEGDVAVQSSSGDLRASDLKGQWSFESSSGDCQIDGFQGDRFEFHSSSGDLVARQVLARDVKTDTSSGDVTFSAADVEDFQAEASSGNVALALDGTRLKAFEVTTSSGDVALRIPDGEAFEASAELSSGDMSVGFSNGDSVYDGESLVGYRRGSGGAKIRVTTSSGDFTITPR